MFEFSGIAAVGNKLIVVDNETGQLGNNNAGISDHFDQAVFEVALTPSGEIELKRAWPDCFAKAPTFDDLEGITARDEFVYFIGSHSTDKEDTYRPERHVFLRLSVGPEGEPLPGTEVEVYKDLSDALLTWAISAGLTSEEIASKKGKAKTKFIKNFDIEGLAAIPNDPGLLLALRGPLHTKAPGKKPHALVLYFANPDEVFEKKNAKPRLATFATLDLKGQGISSIEFDPISQSLLIATTDKNEKQPLISRVWQWALPLKTSAPKEVKTFTGKKIEGVARIPKGHKFEDALLLAFDEEEPGGEAKQFGRLEVMRWVP